MRRLGADLIGPAAALLGRGMRDNPIHVRAFGPEPAHRERALGRMFLPVLRLQLDKGTILGAFQDGRLVGVCGMTRPGRCQPTLLEKGRMLPAVLRGNPPSVAAALIRWSRAWGRLDPAQPHWHLGPVAVDAHLQGRGIGSALLRECCEAVDAEASALYLETDKTENVTFYERFGFGTTAQRPVLGVPNWFMIRRAATVTSSRPTVQDETAGRSTP